MGEKDMKTWEELKRGDRVWINGENGEIGEIRKTLVNDSLVEVRIDTWIHTSEFLNGSYHGPTIIFYKRDSKVDFSDHDALEIIGGEKYKGSEEIVTQDNAYIISLTEQEGEEAKRKLREREKQFKIYNLSSTIEGLEEEIKEKEELLFSLRGELRKVLEQKNEET